MLVTILLLCVVTFVAGVIDSIAGGGGLIKLPAIMLTGVTPQQAMGISKFASTLGTGSAMLNFARSGLMPWKMTLLGVPGALIGSAAGGKCIMLVDPNLAGRVIAVILPIAAVLTLIPWKSRPPKETFTNIDLYVLIPLICFVVGFYDGFIGPGAGTFFIMGLHIAVRMSLIKASAMTKTINLCSNVGALAVFLLNGQVLFMYALPLAVADILGNLVGSQMAIHKGSKLVRAFMVISIVILLISLIYKYF